MRSATLALWVLAACTARSTVITQRPAPVQREPARISAPRHRPTPPSSAVPDDATPRTYESVEERARVREILREPHRAPLVGIYRGGGPIRLRPDGLAVDRDADAGPEFPYPVLETRDDRARIVVVHGGVTWLGWVDLADFVPQPREPLVLASAPEVLPAAGHGRIELAPGERVEIVRTLGEWHEVELWRSGVRGWLPVAAFAPVFVRGGFPVRSQALGATARRRARVLDRPGGKTIWRLSAESESEIDVVAERKGWLEVMIVTPCEDTLRITGFMRKSDVHDISPREFSGFGCGRVGMGLSRKSPDDAIDVRLPEDTELFDDTGRLVGVAGKNNVLRRTPDGALHLRSRWGPVPVFAEVEATPLPPS